MSSAESRYISESPANLSARATEFIRTSSSRRRFDEGLAGRRLREEIVRIYGEPNDAIVDLLSTLQARYGGLSYDSGFFDSEVTFAPVCEPEDEDEELEILYAVETGGSAGASVKVTGEVEVGFDGAGILEFADLDALIECDAMFATANAFEHKLHRYLSVDSVENALRCLRGDAALNLKSEPRASGLRSYWLEGESSMVFLTSVWTDLGLGMPPMIRIWTRTIKEVDIVTSLLTDMVLP